MSRRIKRSTVIGIIVSLLMITGLTLVLYYSGWLSALSDREALQEAVARTGWLAPFTFLTIQIAQVILAPIPGAVTGVASGYLFGAFWGSVITQAGITIGSLIAFALAKRFGRPLVERLVSQKTMSKLDEIVVRRGMSGLFIIFVIPFLPDDAICFVAGLTAINYRNFLLLVLLARTPSSVVSSLTGAGLLSLSPAGWAGFGLFSIIVAYLIFRYEEQIRTRLLDKI